MSPKISLRQTLALSLACTLMSIAGAKAALPPGGVIITDPPIIIIVDRPDLIVSDLQRIAHPTHDIQYRYTISNVGDAVANLSGATSGVQDNVTVQAYVSTDTIYNNGNDLPAGGEVIFGTLNPGQSLTREFGATLAFNPAVHRYLILKVDAGNDLTEGNERNNTLAMRILPVGQRCYSDLPNPLVRIAHTEHITVTNSDVQGTRYDLEVSNWSEYPAELFSAAPDLPACGLNTSASRSWVSIKDPNGTEINGFCSFGQPRDLLRLFLFIRDGTPTPAFVTVEITDRRCNNTYRSQLISTAQLRIAAAPAPGQQIEMSIPPSDAPGFTIEASVDLMNWEFLLSIPNTGGPIQFVDRHAANFSMRFYRATPER